MTTLRVLAVILVLAIIAVAAVPLLVVADLVGGGDGWGLCPEGLSSCHTSYFEGPELAALLAAATFVLVALLRLVFVVQQRLEKRRSRRLSGPVSPPRPPARRPPSA